MQTMTQATADLLKSRSMIGQNKPAHRVTIGGGARTFDPTVLAWKIQGIASTIKSISNWVPTTDGRYMCCWMDSTTKSLQTGYSATKDFFTTNYAMDNVVETAGITVGVVGGYQTALYRRDDGSVLLFVAQNDYSSFARVYISIIGNGDDWTLLQTIFTYDSAGPLRFGEVAMYPPLKTPTGKLVLHFLAGGNLLGISPTYYTAVSDDEGDTWTIVNSANSSSSFLLGQACIIGSNIYACRLSASNYTTLWKSADDGYTWTSVADWSGGFSDVPRANNQGMNLYYDVATDTAYAVSIQVRYSEVFAKLKRPTPTTFEDKTQWNFILNPEGVTGGSFGADRVVKIYDVDGTLAFYCAGYILGVSPGYKDLPCKSISINRTKGAASGLTVTADNKGGLYSPDGQTGWNQILWPNAEIIVEQGYGEDLIQTYKGSLDSVNPSTFPQEIRLSARDAMKKALDQTVTGSTGNHVLIYTNSTVESIFISLCNFAGITYGTVETTGLTIARKEFAWESFADAMQWLAELVGFEIVADEQGLLHFRRDWYPDDGTSVYTFREGEDIISLGYTIDDRDLYNQVICHGRDADGNVLELVTNVPGADYWRLPTNKIMKIDASDANTIDKLNVIAARAIYLMMSRFRVCSFKAIGVPHLQVGDLITVIESSSTISEVYRVTDLATNMDSEGYIMDITCHWYSHG